MSTAVLYHAPPSFYSQVARLVLAEKGVAYDGKVVIPGPPVFETYLPWYLRLNPGGTVPTLVLDDEVLADSLDILRKVGALPDGPSLVSADEDGRATMEAWIERAYSLPERELAYGSGVTKKVGKHINDLRRKVLVSRKRRAAALQDVYAAKIADIDSFIEKSRDEVHVAELGRRYDQSLDELDVLLGRQRWIAGHSYSLADVAWTVTVARQEMLGRRPLEGRGSLAAWFDRVKARPSFTEADVWERFKAKSLLPVIASKMKWPLAVAAAALLAGFASLWYLLVR